MPQARYFPWRVLSKERSTKNENWCNKSTKNTPYTHTATQKPGDGVRELTRRRWPERKQTEEQNKEEDEEESGREEEDEEERREDEEERGRARRQRDTDTVK